MKRISFSGGETSSGNEPLPATGDKTPEISGLTTEGNTSTASHHANELKCASHVEPLEPPDSHHLDAAQGWLGLGDCQSALEELESIKLPLRSHPDVLAVRCDIYTTAMKWPAVVAVASTLVALIPDRPSGWVRRSYALHGLKQTQRAFDLLLPAALRFPEIPTIPYNLACYCAQLGKLEEARRWLQQSYEIGDATILKVAARSDPDLAPLFESTSEP